MRLAANISTNDLNLTLDPFAAIARDTRCDSANLTIYANVKNLIGTKSRRIAHYSLLASHGLVTLSNLNPCTLCRP